VIVLAPGSALWDIDQHAAWLASVVILVTQACVIGTPLLLLLAWPRPAGLRCSLAAALGVALVVVARHGITAVSPQSVWSVGTQGMQTLGPDDERPLVERLGAEGWQVLATPTFDWANLNMLAVAAASASDVYAVGSIDVQGCLPLILHWNGHAWRALPTTGLPAAGVNLTARITRSLIAPPRGPWPAALRRLRPLVGQARAAAARRPAAPTRPLARRARRQRARLGRPESQSGSRCSRSSPPSASGLRASG